METDKRSKPSLKSIYSPRTYNTQANIKRGMKREVKEVRNVPMSPGDTKARVSYRAKIMSYSHNTSRDYNPKTPSKETNKEQTRISLKGSLINSTSKTQRMSAKCLMSKSNTKTAIKCSSLNNFLLATKQLKPQKSSGKLIPRIRIKKPIEDSKDISIVYFISLHIDKKDFLICSLKTKN